MVAFKLLAHGACNSVPFPAEDFEMSVSCGRCLHAVMVLPMPSYVQFIFSNQTTSYPFSSCHVQK